jgi:methionyl-tRNA formyltransferase
VIHPREIRTVFMGTPEFALPSLEGIAAAGVNLLAVFTQPDRPSGRGKKLAAPAVKEYALRRGLKVFQPQRLRDPAVVEELRGLAPNLIVVVAYGQILPRAVLEIPQYGCINVHASLLPRYRGAAPINRAIIEGEQTTGVTTMLMDAGLDTGAMLVKKTTPIGLEETAGELHDRLALLGCDALAETLHLLCSGSLSPEPQDDALSSYAPMLKKEDGRIDWNRSALDIHNQVRGLAPWPGAYTHLQGEPLRLARTLPESGRGGEPGRVLSTGADGLRIACGEGILLVRELQLPGKKRLPAAEFLRGRTIPAGTVLEF